MKELLLDLLMSSRCIMCIGGIIMDDVISDDIGTMSTYSILRRGTLRTFRP